MQATEIASQLALRPFKPFRLCFSDGEALDVRHPEMLMVAQRVLAVATYSGRRRRGMPEGIVFCDPIHVVRLEPLNDGRRNGA